MQDNYSAPDVTLVGSVESLTAATGARNQLDASFPAGTPFGDLTFS